MFEEKTAAQAAEELQTDCRMGLTEKEAAVRLSYMGPNRLREEKKKTALQRFVSQLMDPLIYILLAAAGISLALGEWNDAAIVLIVVVVNALIGMIQEGKAEKALEALKKLTSLKALVRRDGAEKEIPAEEIVKGDLVLLEAGRQVPADLRLVSDNGLKIEEAALTGESVPSEKSAAFLAEGKLPVGDRKNMAYMSTSVIHGRGSGIATATGMQTEIGRIAGMIGQDKTELTALQRKLGQLGKVLSLITLVLCVALFGLAVWQKRDIVEMLITAISLAVAAVPEGLPAIVTITLAFSVSRMVKVHTIIRRLPSVETLGCVNVVCSDKTGTLTQNRMTVTACFTGMRQAEAGRLDARKDEEFLRGFVLCNDAVLEKNRRLGDPTELALLELGARYGLNRELTEQDFPRTGEIPFDSARKRMTTLHRGRKGSISYTKGAADMILDRCSHIWINGEAVPMTSWHRKQIAEVLKQMATKALRVLAVAFKQDNTGGMSEKDMTFLGLAGMMDPVRPDAVEAVERFKKASVRTVMITGDHRDTALAIARQLGIAKADDACITGQELDGMTEEELDKRLPGTTVFARVSPEHKVRIVQAFQRLGDVVAMTGDGINDAPSLKKADIGIAMGKGGTDVAKNAADMVLADDHFSTIEKAIEEGRGIYENIKKSVLFLLSSNFGEVMTMFAAIACGLASPLKPVHILWINLITDSLPAMALGVDENDKKELMARPPRGSREGLFSDGGFAFTVLYGVLIASISLAAFLKIPLLWMEREGIEFSLQALRETLQNPALLARAQTGAFTVLGLSQLFHAVGMRDVHKSVFRMNHLSNKLMILACAAGFFLQFIVTEIPFLIPIFGTVQLNLMEWLELLGLAAMPLVAHEILCFGKNKKK